MIATLRCNFFRVTPFFYMTDTERMFPSHSLMHRYSIDRPSYTKQLGIVVVFSALALFLAGCTTGTDVPDPSVGTGGSIDDQEIGQPELSQVYFSMASQAQDCSAVSPVMRELDVDTTDAEATAEALMDSLLAGPTEEEKTQGYTSQFNEDTDGALEEVIIQNGTAYVNLDDLRETIPNASASCASANMLAQVSQTLRQVPGVTRVVLAFDGNVKNFYDWIQMGCSAENDNCDASVFGGDAGTATGSTSSM